MPRPVTGEIRCLSSISTSFKVGSPLSCSWRHRAVLRPHISSFRYSTFSNRRARDRLSKKPAIQIRKIDDPPIRFHKSDSPAEYQDSASPRIQQRHHTSPIPKKNDDLLRLHKSNSPAEYQDSASPRIRHGYPTSPISRKTDDLIRFHRADSPAEYQGFASPRIRHGYPTSLISRNILESLVIQRQEPERLAVRYDSKPSWDFEEEEAQKHHKLYGECSIHELERQLKDEVTKRPKVVTTNSLLYYLYHYRQAQPTSQHYEYLILAQAEAEHGTCDSLGDIIRDMRKDGFEMESSHLHAALRVLAIHPNYILRSEILGIMRAKNVALSTRGWHDVATALIRERQLELAMHTVEEMDEKKIEVQLWLRRLLLYGLCDVEDFQAAVEVASTLPDIGEEMSMDIWCYLLDISSKAYHHGMVAYIWSKMISKDSFNPATGVCINVLTTAARAGDPRLATSVFRVLTQRNETIQLTEYETLIEALLKASSPESALRVLCALPRVDIDPEDGTTRSLVSFLRADNQYPPSAAWSFLGSLAAEADGADAPSVPIAVVNAIMEAHVDVREPLGAQNVYDAHTDARLPTPNLRTFHILLRACVALGDVQEVERIFRMMSTFDVNADLFSYELAKQTALEARDYKAVDQYAAEIREIGGKVTMESREHVITA